MLYLTASLLGSSRLIFSQSCDLLVPGNCIKKPCQCTWQMWEKDEPRAGFLAVLGWLMPVCSFLVGFSCKQRGALHMIFVLGCQCSAFRAFVTKSWFYTLFCLFVFSMKIKCLSLNPSLSNNSLGDEGLSRLFQFLPNLKMLRSLKWVAHISPYLWMWFYGSIDSGSTMTFRKGCEDQVTL